MESLTLDPITDARQGQRVLVIAEPDEGAALLGHLVDLLEPGEVELSSEAVGELRVDFPSGGSIAVASPDPAGLRGRGAELALVLPSVAASRRLIRELRVLVGGSGRVALLA